MKELGFIFLLFFISCKQKECNLPVITQKGAVTFNKNAKPINYDSCKKDIIKIKKQHLNHWKNLAILEKQTIFTQAITQTLLPNWVGTKWDFNGTTQVPQQGAIACGYFVTTVLQDGGIKLNRVKLAQCASEQMITTLLKTKLIKRFSKIPMQHFILATKQWGYGLYVIGLDNHTGFIFNDGNKIHFIHSTFVGSKNVQWEDAEKSWVLSSSKYKVLGKISEDENILNRWITN